MLKKFKGGENDIPTIEIFDMEKIYLLSWI